MNCVSLKYMVSFISGFCFTHYRNLDNCFGVYEQSCFKGPWNPVACFFKISVAHWFLLLSTKQQVPSLKFAEHSVFMNNDTILKDFFLQEFKLFFFKLNISSHLNTLVLIDYKIWYWFTVKLLTSLHIYLRWHFVKNVVV